jgi:hypothetical protein
MKSTKTVSQDSRSPVRDLNPEPPEYEVELLTSGLQRSVVACNSVGTRRAILGREACTQHKQAISDPVLPTVFVLF